MLNQKFSNESYNDENVCRALKFKLKSVSDKFVVFYCCETQNDYNNLIVEIIEFDVEPIYFDDYFMIGFTGNTPLELKLIKEKFIEEIIDKTMIKGKFQEIEKLDVDILKSDIMINTLANY